MLFLCLYRCQAFTFSLAQQACWLHSSPSNRSREHGDRLACVRLDRRDALSRISGPLSAPSLPIPDRFSQYHCRTGFRILEGSKKSRNDSAVRFVRSFHTSHTESAQAGMGVTLLWCIRMCDLWKECNSLNFHVKEKSNPDFAGLEDSKKGGECRILHVGIPAQSAIRDGLRVILEGKAGYSDIEIGESGSAGPGDFLFAAPRSSVCLRDWSLNLYFELKLNGQKSMNYSPLGGHQGAGRDFSIPKETYLLSLVRGILQGFKFRYALN